MTSSLLPIGLEATAPSHVSTTFLATAFQAFQYHFGKWWSEWEMTW